MTDNAKVEELMGRVVADIAAAGGMLMTIVGLEAGLWQALAGAGPLTPDEVAQRSQTDARLVEEWLKGQAAGGYVTYHADTRLFSLSDEAAAVFVGDAGRSFVSGFGKMMTAMTADLPDVTRAYRDGGGLGWHERSALHWDGADEATQGFIGPVLVPSWLPALDGVEERLRAGGRVADIGCGYGAPTIAMAHAFPNARFWGFDYHDGSIARARKAAATAGVADRTQFEVAPATGFPGRGYDLIAYFDALHDLGDPVGALRHSREALAGDGVVLLVEPNGADRVEDNFNTVGRLMYTASAIVCTPNARAHEGHALGTLAGERRLREVAEAAGFTRIRRVPVDAPFNLLLGLRA